MNISLGPWPGKSWVPPYSATLMTPESRFCRCSRMMGPLMQLPSQADISTNTLPSLPVRSSSRAAMQFSTPSMATQR